MRRIRVNGELCALPFSRHLPPHTEQQFAGLREHIQEHARVYSPVITFTGDDGRSVLDGATRATIAEELGLSVPEHYLGELVSPIALNLCLALNAHRRHLEPRHYAEIVLKMRREGESLRTIHAVSGIPLGTVRNIVAEHTDPTPGLFDDSDDLEEGVDYVLPDRVTGRDGKSHPAKKPAIHDNLPGVVVGERPDLKDDAEVEELTKILAHLTAVNQAVEGLLSHRGPRLRKLRREMKRRKVPALTVDGWPAAARMMEAVQAVLE